ncbi:MAG TPA: hypothetical protein VMF59_05910 [Bacteroidota bacterium]|nr:hypothetical protein [Bacteroidota bacterium]
MLIILSALFRLPLPAQQPSWDYAGGGFGASDFHVRDDHASPLVFRAWGIAPVVQFIHAGEGNRHYFEAAYSPALLSSAPANFRTDNWRGRIRYAYLVQAWDLGSAERPLRMFLGGSATSFLQRANYYYFIPPLNGYGTSIDSWYWSSSLDAAVNAEYDLAEREFVSVQCFVPLLSNVSRPRYSPSGDYSYTENTFKMKMFGRTQFFPKNISADILLSFQAPVFWRFNAGVSYEFYFASYDLPREVKMYMNNARGGVFFCF